MNLHGSCLRFPFSADRRGSLAVVGDRAGIVRQSIIAIIETRQGERVMMPDYGIPDMIFSVVNAGFAARFAYVVERQIKNYEPLVETVKVRAGSAENEGTFDLAPNLHRAAIEVTYTVRGRSVPYNLVYPVWRLRAEA
ncbi:MAG: GPW/gp25 family protein [Pyrinomonadaceae bacterium]